MESSRASINNERVSLSHTALEYIPDCNYGNYKKTDNIYGVYKKNTLVCFYCGYDHSSINCPYYDYYKQLSFMYGEFYEDPYLATMDAIMESMCNDEETILSALEIVVVRPIS